MHIEVLGYSFSLGFFIWFLLTEKLFSGFFVIFQWDKPEKYLFFGSFVIWSTGWGRTHHGSQGLFFFFFFTVANYPLVLSLFLPLSFCRQSSVRYMMFRLHDTSEFQSPGRCPRLSSFPLSHCLSIQANVGNAASPLWTLVSSHRNAVCAHFKLQDICTCTRQ